ncbi:enoyl-CoA hydratase [Murinocardiopsis flavida]|uniref:Enoyl-CoA hydratase n=1 Tax=Murinocardiopsis flavida TaxID=645275 RepID=A0A2P8CLX4_9ACTN|nr:enoyl-CoA hydratase-related protein [Murinocardiopsis flavida]PSK85965.1 enoyl-CoA hydratase [Murinocardiopsis flavida]
MTATAELTVDGHVAVLRLANPPLNIITAEMRPHILAAIERVRAAEDIRALVVTGAGERAFCAGADLNEEADLTPETVRRFLADDCAIYDGLAELPVPVIAAVNGHCMGGGLELALSCDLRVAADDAKHRAAGVRVGLVVSTTRITRLAGPAVAKDVVLTGRTFSGAEALRLGLATLAVPRGEVLATALDMAAEIASRAPLAVRRAKTAIEEAAELPFAEAMERELDHFAALSATADHKHAIEAFFERRTPRFTGR